MEEITVQLPKIFLRNFESLAKCKNSTVNQEILYAMGTFMTIYQLDPKEVAVIFRRLAETAEDL